MQIHQPSSFLYSQLDTVLLLSQVGGGSDGGGEACAWRGASLPPVVNPRVVEVRTSGAAHVARLQGHPIYYGKGCEAAAWFDCLGVPCPAHVNIADWILDLASGEVAGKKK